MADVVSNLAGWSATSGSNQPQGSTTVGTGLDDNIREIQGVVVRGLSYKGADIASAATTDIGAVEGLMHDITGTTWITSLGTGRQGLFKILQFDASLTITHSASLALDGAANITTEAGDVLMVISEGGGVWRQVAPLKHATITGSGNPVYHNTPTLVAPVLGTPTSGTLTNCTGLPVSSGISGLGTGVAAALAVSVGSAGAFVVNGGVLGTPSSGTLTNCTGLPTAGLLDDAVTYAKMQNVTDARVLGRAAGSAGDCQELSAGTNMTIASSTISTTAEINTASNLGSTGIGVFDSKSGVDLRFNKIDVSGGGSIALASNVITISVHTHGVGGMTSLHADCLIDMADGSRKFLRDIRLGDVVKTPGGSAEVLGVWTSQLWDRDLWFVDACACTAAHLFRTRTGWAAPVPSDYGELVHGRRRVVKGRNGVIETVADRIDPATVERLVVGTEILQSDGSYKAVTSLSRYTGIVDKSLTEMTSVEFQPVFALHLGADDTFFADGFAVSTLS